MSYVAAKELGAPMKMRGREDAYDLSGDYKDVFEFINDKYPEEASKYANTASTTFKHDAAMVRATWEISQLSLRDEPEEIF